MVQDLALSQVCTTGGLRRKEFVYMCISVYVCVGVCAGVCGAAKLATCLSLVVVLVFPFIRPSAAQLPLGAVSLLPCATVCVSVCVCVCVAQVPVGLERLMFLKVHFALSPRFLYLCSLCFIETVRVEAGSWPTGLRSRRGHQRKLLLQCQQEVTLQEKHCYLSIFN